MRHTILSILFAIFATAAAGQSVTVSGRVTDKASGEALEGVSVAISQSRNGAVTDNKGEYKITVPRGNYILTASFVGYDSEKRTVAASGSIRVDFELTGNTEIERIVVSTRPANINVTDPTMGFERLTVGEIRRIPALLGEVDIIRAIQMMPGVQATSEGSSGFSVRGGAPDQNLILFDNSTIYNASHLMGFFSLFNHDVVSSAELYKGDLPLAYGGRLASLLDVRTRNDFPEKFKGSGGIGLISSRLTVEGPIGKNTSWLAGARRSYADLFLVFSKNEALRKSSLYFYDFNAKLNHRFGPNDMLEVNGYYGRDLYAAEVARFFYGNGTASATWRHRFSNTLNANFSANFSHYHYTAASEIANLTGEIRSNISDLMLRADFTHRISPLWNLSYGATSTYHHLTPAEAGAEGVDASIMGSNALEHGIYISNHQEINDIITLRYGVRLSIFQSMGRSLVYDYDENHEAVGSTDYRSGQIYNTYAAAEPRAGIVVKTGETSSIKANYARNTQFMQLASNSSSGSPLDVWFPASPNIKPQRSQMFSLGYFRNFAGNTYEASVEGYYKHLTNVIDFKEHANLLLSDKLEGEVRVGNGRAYGLEFMLRKNSGAVTGFVNYTLARAERTIPDVNNGETYVAPYDRTHSVNISVNWDISSRWSISASWIYGTGTPITLPVGYYEVGELKIPIFSKRNEYRLPDYHRLDLAAIFVPNPGSTKRIRGEWNFSVYNAYNRKNPWMINFSQDESTYEYSSEMTYLFGIVPSITYNFLF